MSFADYLERHWGIDSEDYEPEPEPEGDDDDDGFKDNSDDDFDPSSSALSVAERN